MRKSAKLQTDPRLEGDEYGMWPRWSARAAASRNSRRMRQAQRSYYWRLPRSSVLLFDLQSLSPSELTSTHIALLRGQGKSRDFARQSDSLSKASRPFESFSAWKSPLPRHACP